MEPKYDFSKYTNCDCKLLALAYGCSASTFRRNTLAIKPQLNEMRKKIRPDAVKGPRYWSNEMLELLFNHLGGEPPRSIKDVQKPSDKVN